MCVVQLRCDICEIATILNEFNQSLERKKHLSSLVYVLKKFDKLPLRKFCLLLYVHYLVGLCNVQCLDQEHSTQNLLWNIIFNFGFKIQPVKRFFFASWKNISCTPCTTKNWEFSSIFFWMDDETLLSRWLIYMNSAFVEWTVSRRRVLISFGKVYLHVYCILFVKAVTAGVNF